MWAAYFRGSIAPASLKLRGGEGYDRAAVKFPGLYCPGLIEAVTYSYAVTSEGGFPGLYCPGLIEAG